MKLLIAAIFMVAVTCCYGQNRPFYAPRPQQYPTLLSRFGETDLNNRVGEENQPTARPVLNIGGSIVDQDLIDRVANWPADKQPFWFVNRQQIQNHVQNPPTFVAQPPPTSFFAGGK